jgi:hypothetical protein
MKMRCLSMLSLMVLATGQGACSLAVETDVPDVEITQRGVRFDGNPAAQKLGMASTSRSFQLSSNAAWAKELNSEVQAGGVTVRSGTGVPNLDFIKYASVTMVDSSGAVPPVKLMSYERPDGAPSSTIIEATMAQAVDLTALWKSESSKVEVKITGELPANSWTADIVLHLSGKITYEY